MKRRTFLQAAAATAVFPLNTLANIEPSVPISPGKPVIQPPHLGEWLDHEGMARRCLPIRFLNDCERIMVENGQPCWETGRRDGATQFAHPGPLHDNVVAVPVDLANPDYKKLSENWAVAAGHLRVLEDATFRAQIHRDDFVLPRFHLQTLRSVANTMNLRVKRMFGDHYMPGIDKIIIHPSRVPEILEHLKEEFDPCTHRELVRMGFVGHLTLKGHASVAILTDAYTSKGLKPFCQDPEDVYMVVAPEFLGHFWIHTDRDITAKHDHFEYRETISMKTNPGMMVRGKVRLP